MSSWWCGSGGATAVAQRWRSGGCTLSCVRSSGVTAWRPSAGALMRCQPSIRFWNKWLKSLHQFDPPVSSAAWGFECHQLASIYIPEVSMEQILKLSVYSAQPPLAGCADKLEGYSKLPSQQCSWHLATEGLAWQLQMRPQGWDRRGGMAKALDFHWASASSLKQLLEDGRWRTTWAGGVFPKLPGPLGEIKQLCCASFQNHLASVAAAPAGGIKMSSFRWKDRQCKLSWSFLWHSLWGRRLREAIRRENVYLAIDTRRAYIITYLKTFM